MNKFLYPLLVGAIVFIALSCDNTSHVDNPVLGKWKSAFGGSENRSLDFSISFESNNTYHIEVFGGQTEPEKILGHYKVSLDTILLVDKLGEPQVCNYADTGKYTFIKRKDTLLFKVIKDLCEKRKLTLEIGLVKAK